MPLPTNINAYADIKAVLEPTIAAGGGKYRLPSPKEAVRWRQRAYRYRILLQRQLAAASNLKGYTPPTAYDAMRLTISIGDPRTVIIEMVEQPMGELILNTGETFRPQVQVVEAPAKPDAPIPQAEEDALLTAANLLRLGVKPDEN